MYFIPVALLIKVFAPTTFWAATGASAADYPSLTVQGLVANLVPVTIGNIIGGAAMVGIVYWFIYLRPKRAEQARLAGRGRVGRPPARSRHSAARLGPTLEPRAASSSSSS
jgi:hypothetical protein